MARLQLKLALLLPALALLACAGPQDSQPLTGAPIGEARNWSVNPAEVGQSWSAVAAGPALIVLVYGMQNEETGRSPVTIQRRSHETGELLWSRALSDSAIAYRNAVMADGVIAIAFADGIVALDADTGIVAWQRDVAAENLSAAGREIVFTAEGTTTVLGAARGDTRAEVDSEGWALVEVAPRGHALYGIFASITGGSSYTAVDLHSDVLTPAAWHLPMQHGAAALQVVGDHIYTIQMPTLESVPLEGDEREVTSVPIFTLGEWFGELYVTQAPERGHVLSLVRLQAWHPESPERAQWTTYLATGTGNVAFYDANGGVVAETGRSHHYISSEGEHLWTVARSDVHRGTAGCTLIVASPTGIAQDCSSVGEHTLNGAGF